MYHPKVFRVIFHDNQHHRKDIMGGLDSEYSHTTREQFVEYVVAPDLETAQFLWTHRCRLIKTRCDIMWEELGYVSLMIQNIHGV